MQELFEPYSIVLIGMVLSWMTSFFTSYSATALAKKLVEKKKQITKAGIGNSEFNGDGPSSSSGCCVGPLVFLIFLNITLTEEQIIAYLNSVLIVILMLGSLVASLVGPLFVKMQK